jgi:hypothetical protein
MKRKKRIDTRPLNQRVKKYPYVIGEDGIKRNLIQRLKIPNKIRFPENEDENDTNKKTDK